jgi:hypothetical protein
MDDKIWANLFEPFFQIDKQMGQPFEYSTKIGGHTLGMGKGENESARPGLLARRLKQNLSRDQRELREHHRRALWARKADERLQPIEPDTQDVSRADHLILESVAFTKRPFPQKVISIVGKGGSLMIVRLMFGDDLVE